MEKQEKMNKSYTIPAVLLNIALLWKFALTEQVFFPLTWLCCTLLLFSVSLAYIFMLTYIFHISFDVKLEYSHSQYIYIYI